MRAPFAVRRVNRVGGVGNPHLTTLAVAVDRGLGRVNGDMLVVHTQTCAVRISVGYYPRQQHFIWRETGARYSVAGLKRSLFDLAVEIDRVAIQGHLTDFLQRVVGVRPHLGQIEGVDVVGL